MTQGLQAQKGTASYAFMLWMKKQSPRRQQGLSKKTRTLMLIGSSVLEQKERDVWLASKEQGAGLQWGASSSPVGGALR